jgi:hypothetical protein
MSIVGELKSEIALAVFADEKYIEKMSPEQAVNLIQKIQEALNPLSENEVAEQFNDSKDNASKSDMNNFGVR